ncbi:hypothetical protein A1O7_06194 [Cladophialophora yegresii CBS 114405]|uniref:NACHT domain-containing protein n=1 Tax=Cladophialophora yegresii CBS 114405 TaxID=1182544 RepID=W9WJU1_9EURO|nr:uncharacterized protein A1O7_06194 [Cladophialophora yegresii CBS 114405]EXJ58764.1 hypothetical protein A1O7_06194 [Cladophialophora yegresii CBS 114405]
MQLAVDDASNKLHSDIAAVLQQMDHLKLQDSTYENQFARFQASHADTLSRLSLGIESIMLEQEAIRTTSDKQRAQVAQQRICMSLSFCDMVSRQGRIREAHEGTYGWILAPCDTTDNGLSDFHSWLAAPAPDHGLFWISGKPGSGKSTLMRYLDDHLKPASCTNWLSGYGLFICRYFLWNPGRGLQRSFQGLLQALLHQLLWNHQWLIETIVSEERWLTACATEPELQWSTPELKTTIVACLQRIATTRKILILADGLDELDGTDDDRHDMLDFLHRLPQLGSIKVCLSSRPWNIFADSFYGLPQIQLHLFTRMDIEKYVRQSLSHSMRHQSSYLHNSGQGERLIQMIVDKANGVFLWVRLVVQELMRGFRDGETIRTLERKVVSMPADLDGFFKRIISSIDPAYRSEASAFLQTALFCRQNSDVEWPRGLLELTFLEVGDPDFAMRPSWDLTELNLDDLDALEYRIDLGKRRLNSRCMGLLDLTTDREISWAMREEGELGPRFMNVFCAKVDFLHRSLMDYLLTDDAQGVLQQCTDGPFQARRFLCSALIARVRAIHATCAGPPSRHSDYSTSIRSQDTRFLADQTDLVLRAIGCSKDLEPPTMNIIMRQLEPTLELLHHCSSSDSHFLLREMKRLVDSLDTSVDRSISIAIGYNLTGFVVEHLTRDKVKGISGQALLESALKPPFPRGPNPEMVRIVLQAGVDPNYPRSICWEYLRDVCLSSLKLFPSDAVASSYVVDIIGIMIENKVDISCPADMLSKLNRIVKGDPKTGGSFVAGRGRGSKVHGARPSTIASSLVRSRASWTCRQRQ